MSDEELFEKGYNRVYDTLEMEANLNYVEEFSRQGARRPRASQELSSEIICRALGKVLAEDPHGAGVLRSAYLKDVPVYVPAFTDSELGLDLSTWAMKRAQAKGDEGPDGPLRRHPPLQPLPRPQQLRALRPRARSSSASSPSAAACRATGPRRSGPTSTSRTTASASTCGRRATSYAVRICPEPTHWGGLSGCTYSEGVSWGKFVPESEGGRFAEVYADATTVWPLLIKGVLEELG